MFINPLSIHGGRVANEVARNAVGDRLAPQLRRHFRDYIILIIIIITNSVFKYSESYILQSRNTVHAMVCFAFRSIQPSAGGIARET